MRDRFVKRLTSLAEKDRNIILITGDLGYGVLNEFAEKFPDQYINAGVAEQNMTGMASGLALSGKTVITYSIGNFNTLRCLEQIRNDACYHNCSVKIVSVGGGFSYGQLGYSHHATEDISIMRSLPNIHVYVPGCLWEAEEITEAMIYEPGVSYLRLDKSSAGNTQQMGETFTVGKARILKEGKDVTLIATGGILAEVLKAANLLDGFGIKARVISFPSIKPFDQNALIAAVDETRGIFTIEEHNEIGGLGTLVSSFLMRVGKHPGFFEQISLEDQFSTIVGDQNFLRKYYGLDAESIVDKVRKRYN